MKCINCKNCNFEYVQGIYCNGVFTEGFIDLICEVPDDEFEYKIMFKYHNEEITKEVIKNILLKERLCKYFKEDI